MQACIKMGQNMIAPKYFTNYIYTILMPESEAEEECHPVGQKCYTNSLIRIEVPPNLAGSALQPQQYLFQWISQPNPRLHPNAHILTRYDINKISKSSELQCTPLDYGSVIVSRLLLLRGSLQEVIKETQIGPIAPEKTIGQFIDDDDPSDVKIVLGKNLALLGSIKIIPTAQAPTNMSHNSTISYENKASVKLEAPHFELEIKIDQNTRLPSNNSFFKFYDKEDDSVGISVYHQHSQLVEKMRDRPGGQHCGFYVKVCFRDRIERDTFLFRLMMRLGVRVEGLNASEQEQNKEEFKINVKQVKQMAKNQPIASSPLRRNTKQIDDEILKLLRDEETINHNELSLDMAEAEFLLASSKCVQLPTKSVMKDSDMQNSEEKTSSLLKQKNQNRPQTKLNNHNISVNKQHIDDDASNKSHSSRKIAKNYSSIITAQGNNENYLRSTISKLRDQVQNLMKENRKLAQQNKRLKDQNMRLRLKEIKNTSISRVQQRGAHSPPANKDKSPVKERSSSIAPATHKKRNSIMGPELKKSPSHHGNNQSPTRPTGPTFQKDLSLIQDKKQAQLTSSSGSILLSSGQTRKAAGGGSQYQPNSSSTKDLARQYYEPQQKARGDTEKMSPYVTTSGGHLVHNQRQGAGGYGIKNMAHSQAEGLTGGGGSYLKPAMSKNVPNFGFSSIQFTNSTTFRR